MKNRMIKRILEKWVAGIWVVCIISSSIVLATFLTRSIDLLAQTFTVPQIGAMFIALFGASMLAIVIYFILENWDR